MRNTNNTSEISTFHLRRRTPGTFLLVPCQRIGRSIRCQGQLEAATAQILAASPLVENIEEQPCTIHYAWRQDPLAIQLIDNPAKYLGLKNERISYIVPDFLVTMCDQTKWLIEVKPSQKLTDYTIQRKLAVGKQFATRSGWKYRILTELDLFQNPLLRNIRLLNRFRANSHDPLLLERVRRAVALPAQSIDAICELLSISTQECAVKSAVMHLLATSQIDADLISEPLTAQTLLYPRGTFVWDPFVSVWAPSGSSTNGPSGSSVS